MGTKIFNNAWFIGVKGIALVLLAIYAFIDRAPGLSSSMISTTGYILIISGIAVATFGLSNKRLVIIWFFVTEAIVDIFFGFVILMGQTHFQNRAYQWLLGVWILVIGFMLLLERLEKKKFLANKALRWLIWSISLITGLLFLLPATSSALPMSVVFGAYLVLLGAFYIIQFMKYSRLS